MKKVILFSCVLYIINIVAIIQINSGLNIAISILLSTIIYFLINVVVYKIYQNKSIYNLFFFIIIAVILSQGIIFFNFSTSISGNENRKLADFPDKNVFHEEFADKMDNYINDRIGLRTYGINLYGQFDYLDSLNMHSSVISGINDWLFLNKEHDDILYFQRTKKYSEDKLKQVKQLIDKNIEFCDKNGIKLITVIPPNKSTVYPEYYNPYINKISGQDNYIILQEYIKKEFPNLHLVMPYDDLKGIHDNISYFLHDTHWNTLGAYTAYKVLEKEIIKLNKNYQVLDKSHIKSCQKVEGNDLVSLGNKIGYKQNKYQGICLDRKQVLPLKIDNKNKNWVKAYGREEAPRILLIHDSFMTALSPFIETGVSYIANIYTYDADFNKMKDDILRYNPDIIIWERLERYWFWIF